jgi:hypothetical protein
VILAWNILLVQKSGGFVQVGDHRESSEKWQGRAFSPGKTDAKL